PGFRFDAKMVVDPETAVAENLPRIEKAFWIEGRLDLAHDPEQLLADLSLHVLRAGHADAMFRRERSFELPNECCDLVRDESIFPQAARRVKIEHRPDMEQPGRSVAIITNLQ